MHRRVTCRIFIALLVSVLAPVGLAAPTTIRINVGSNGERANDTSGFPAISADGRFVAFSSYASNLVPDDVAKTRDVFLWDRNDGSLVCVTTALDGKPCNAVDGWPSAPAITPDGRYIAFSSLASNLVPNDTNNAFDVFVYDRITRAIERVNVASSGAQSAGDTARIQAPPVLSADGRFVAFLSDASDLVPGDTNGKRDVFVHDRQTGETYRASVTSSGGQSSVDCSAVSMSADGRYVCFGSTSMSGIARATTYPFDIYVHDHTSGQTELVYSRLPLPGSFMSTSEARLSADARYVLFCTQMDGVTPDDHNLKYDVFRLDRTTGEIQRASVASDGTEGNNHCLQSDISSDGRFVTFTSYASNLVPDDSNGTTDLFVHDFSTSRTARIAITARGTESKGMVGAFSATPDGRTIAFESSSSDIIPGDTNANCDIFVRGPLDVPVPGDLDGSGVLSMRDVLPCLRTAAGLPADAVPDLALADLDGDGSITVSDSVALLRRIWGTDFGPAVR